MSQNDNTPDQGGTGAGGSSSYGGRGGPEYGQRIEGAPSGPSYEAPRYGQGTGGDQYSSPQYGQGQYDQGQQGQYGGGQYGQDQYGQGQYGQGQYGGGQYGAGQYGQDQYSQGQYGGQGYPAQYQQGQGYPGQQGQYDMGQYGAGAKPQGTGLGIAALILGIVSLLTCWFVLGLVPGLVGLVLGIVAVRKLGRTPGASKAVPIIGIVLSVLGILASIFFLVIFGALLGEFGPAMEACNQYSSDPTAFQQCIEREMGLTTQNL
ncbi:DUF4190 domain-containing protein [Kocuria turfanensis]|uniref:DUF4190 domain-containing protein n=1 Tax=Kocuria turfanensis TaxID=388357 RepID=A0A512I8K2_9MICC|nr:DUF4190 domain-containing protein [Kocuria turfanensis]GEO94032.1 hypothetical protein KTU01_01550 [Kocuria turfanensis]